MALLFAALLIFSPPTRADELNAIAIGLGELSRITASLKKDPHCWVGQEQSGKTCRQLTDELCEQLHDVHRGSTRVFDGALRPGRSQKSKLSYAQLEEYNALADSAPRLPDDLRAKAAPTLARLKLKLEAEDESVQWKRDVADLHREFERAVEDTATARRDAAHPDLKGLREAAMSYEDAHKSRQVTAKLQDEILDAKYAQHPNWKRVEALFPEAKEDMLKTIDSLPVSAERKTHMKERVRTINLTLPYGNPERTPFSDECGTTMENALYSPTFHQFTICAGMFNTMQSPTALLQTIFHEIGHAIDPNAYGTDQCRAHSHVNKSLNVLVGTSGQALSCDTWNDLEETLLDREPPPPREDELDRLYSCLERGNPPKPWNQDRVREESELDARREIARVAARLELTELAMPTYRQEGRPEANEAYLKPDLLILAESKRPSKAGTRDVDSREVFTQVLACQTVSRGGATIRFTDEGITEAERKRMFDQALAKTTRLLAAKYEDEYSYCGQRCGDLKAIGMGQDLGEHFADWVATRSLWRHLARVPAGTDRQHAAALLGAFHCEGASAHRSSGELGHAETRLSLKPHPNSTRRRNSMFDEVSAGLVGCKLEREALESFGACEP